MSSLAWAEGAGGEEVDCRVEWQLPCRVQCVDVHATRSLVAVGQADGMMQVWDYGSGMRVFEWNGQTEAEGEASDAAAQDLLQRSADWAGPREESAAQTAAGLERIKFGAVRLVRFIDDDVRQWLARRGHIGPGALAQGQSSSGEQLTKRDSLKPTDLPPASPATPRSGRPAPVERLVLYAGDACAALVSYGGGRTRRFETEKSVCAAEWVGRVGCLALGHVDGSVRLVDPDAPHASVDSTRLVRGHGKPVVRLVAYESRGEPMLVAVGADGFISVWALNAPLSDDKRDKGAPANPVRYKLHSSDGLASSGVQLSDETLYTAGAGDRQVCVWDLRSAKELLRARALRSVPLVACEPLVHPRFAPGSCVVAAGGEYKGRVLVAEIRAEEAGAIKDAAVKQKALDEATRVREVVNTAEWWARPGKKNGPRVLGLWLHPLAPHLFFVATKNGLTLATLEPQRAPAYALPEPLTRPLSLLTLPDERLLVLVQGARATFAGLTLERDGRKLRVVSSPSGKLFALHALDTGRYSVHLSTAPHSVQEEGYARSIAFGPGDGFLCLELKAGVAAGGEEGSKKKKRSKDKTPTEKPPPRVECRWRDNMAVIQSVDLTATLRGAERVHGGHLLGVESESDAGAEQIQLYAWGTWLPVGSPLPRPELLRWHPAAPLLLLAYRTHALVMRLSPSLQPLCFLPRQVTSALWHHQALLYATPLTLEMFYPARHPSPPFLLASFRPTADSSLPGASSSSASPSASPASASPSSPSSSPAQQQHAPSMRRQALYGPVGARPQGSVALVGLTDEALWLLESSEDRLASVSLACPAHRCLLHVATRQYDKALGATSQVQACYHRALAALLLSLEQPLHALRLTGLAASERLELCRAHKLYEEAPEVVTACVAAREQSAEDDEKRDPTAQAAQAAQLATSALALARGADLAGAYRKSLALYREALRLSPDTHRAMVGFYVRNGKLKKLASLHKKQAASGAAKAEEAAFAALFLEPEQYNASLAHNPTLAHLPPAPPIAPPLRVQFGGLPAATLLPPEGD